MEPESTHSTATEPDRQEDSFVLTAKPHEEGWRLDHYLAYHLSSYSRSQLSSATKSGFVVVNGESAKPSRKLSSGDCVSGHVEQPPPLSVSAQKVQFEILFEDDYLLFISKPPDLVVHPANGNPDQTLVNGLLYHYGELEGVGDALRPGIVHRLDKDTSGIMVVAKTSETHRMLVAAFKERRVVKKYHAIVHGWPEEEEGRIVAPIGRHPVNRKKMAIRETGGKYAATRWRLLAEIDRRFSLVELAIETGRTHQIRLHLASIGHPVAGDTLYGPGKDNRFFQRQMLHSSVLRLVHPITGREMKITALPHHDFVSCLQKLGYTGEMV